MGRGSVEIAYVLGCDLAQTVFAGQEDMVERLGRRRG